MVEHNLNRLGSYLNCNKNYKFWENQKQSSLLLKGMKDHKFFRQLKNIFLRNLSKFQNKHSQCNSLSISHMSIVLCQQNNQQDNWYYRYKRLNQTYLRKFLLDMMKDTNFNTSLNYLQLDRMIYIYLRLSTISKTNLIIGCKLGIPALNHLHRYRQDIRLHMLYLISIINVE